MIRFEKVSYEQFKKDCEKLGYECNGEIYANIELPKRSTSGSAGYDFKTPFSINLKRFNKTATIPTGIRVIMPQNKVLLIVPRSGIGFKTGTRLANTVGVIDSDYSGSENEGHIMAKFEKGFNKISLNPGDKVMQGIITNYYVTDDDLVKEQRNGGMGSTGK